MPLYHLLILAVLQGITEFLPISSSGHVVLLSEVLAGGQPHEGDILEVNLVLHLGTLLSILVFYCRRILALVSNERSSLKLLALATVPAVAFGLVIKKTVPDLLESPLLAGVMLIVTGMVLLRASRYSTGLRDFGELSNRQAIWIGFSQAAAILPGMSRSGATISAGIGTGLKPEQAATFSFLMAIPIIAGGGLYEIMSMGDAASSSETPAAFLLLAGAVSFIVGLGALRWLIRWLEAGRLQWFAAWCIPLGVVVVIWQICK